ncbi:hypothetical protein [Immundisolibacter sp.]|uniref:hypothetical protein n=1 Tax=Immundisolibacter sp. TaxID=1934948 RepID=UPI0035657B98
MEALTIVIEVLISGGVLGIAVVAIWIVGFAVWMFLPALLGLGLGIWLWVAGHDNIGVVLIISGFIAQALWNRKFKTGGYDPMGGKSKIYDKSGNVVGYRDKD